MDPSDQSCLLPTSLFAPFIWVMTLDLWWIHGLHGQLVQIKDAQEGASIGCLTVEDVLCHLRKALLKGPMGAPMSDADSVPFSTKRLSLGLMETLEFNLMFGKPWWT